MPCIVLCTVHVALGLIKCVCCFKWLKDQATPNRPTTPKDWKWTRVYVGDMAWKMLLSVPIKCKPFFHVIALTKVEFYFLYEFWCLTFNQSCTLGRMLQTLFLEQTLNQSLTLSNSGHNFESDSIFPSKILSKSLFAGFNMPCVGVFPFQILWANLF